MPTNVTATSSVVYGNARARVSRRGTRIDPIRMYQSMSEFMEAPTEDEILHREYNTLKNYFNHNLEPSDETKTRMEDLTMQIIDRGLQL